MAQFDVRRLRSGGLVIDCQSDLLRSLPTRMVVPLRPADVSVMRRLNPVFRIEDRDYAMITQLVGAADRRDLTETLMSLAEHEFEIKDALDMMITGF